MTLGPVAPDTEESMPATQASEDVPKAIEGRSLGRIAWTRLKRDRVAIAGGIFVIFLILVAIFAPLEARYLGHPINEFHPEEINANLGGLPNKPWGGISGKFIFGVQPTFGRDLFTQIVYGARISLLVASLATLVAVVIGVVLGIVAGYFGGMVDSLISRTMDLFLAFPLLLFAIALISVLPQRTSVRLFILVLIIGGFSWPYIGRIVRGQTLSLREREFVEAARSIGSRSPRILLRELLPNLAAPILVYSTLIIPTNILFEAALSFLGVGVQPPTPSWGQLLSDAVSYYEYDPMYMIIPGMAIFLTVLAFNLFGDGLRDALDPRGDR